MADFLGVDVSLPNFQGFLAGSWLWALVLLLIVIIVGIFLVLFLYYKTYNRKIILFENISGQGYQPTLRDRARIVKIGDGGEELLRLSKSKVFRTAYGKKMGKRTYWFAVGQDGYWYNVVLGDLDAKMGMLDIEPIDRDMRYMHVAIRKNIQERYKKLNFMEKYGNMMIGVVFLIVLIVGIWFIVSQIGKSTQALVSTQESNQQTIEASRDILVALENILKADSSGIKSVSNKINSTSLGG